MNYEEFLKSKRIEIKNSGFNLKKEDLNKKLFEFQKDIVCWALKKGKAAIFANTGLGKTAMQLEFSYQVWKKENKPILILAPLAVSEQTIREAKKLFNYEVKFIEKNEDVINGINITNYEKLHKFNANQFICIVLDESSILKSFNGKIRTEIINKFEKTQYKLACTATPSPNDFMELGNHSEFLNVMKRNEMLSMFFIHDSGETSKWRLKGHADSKFWEWVANWAVVIRDPSELGYDDSRYNLPKLNIKEIFVKSDYKKEGLLFNGTAKTLMERRKARKESLISRVLKASEIANNSNEIFLVWCELNDESKQLKNNITDSVEIKGADKPDHKKKSLLEFSENKIKCLISKPKLSGFGMNWQNCNNMIFTGLSDSFEQYYQAVRRCWRFGQNEEVNVYIITSEQEGSTLDNIKRKERDYNKMMDKMSELTIKIVKQNLFYDEVIKNSYNPKIEMKLPTFLKEET